MTAKTRWTEDEKLMIEARWMDPDGPAELVDLLGRTYDQIKAQANKLGVHRRGPHGKKKYRKPRPLPPGAKEGAPCPGNGNGWCGSILYRDRVQDAKGFTTAFFDLCCGTHRFPEVKP